MFTYLMNFSPELVQFFGAFYWIYGTGFYLEDKNQT